MTTTEQKLTNEELSKVFSMYFGCEVVTNAGWSAGGYSAKYRDISLSNIEMLVINARHFFDEPEESPERKVQISLRHLSNITDEDAIEVAELINNEKYDKAETFKVIRDDGIVTIYSSEVIHKDLPGFGFRYTTKIYTGDCFVVNKKPHSPVTEMPFFAYQYLIQKGYDVPLFFGIDHWANGKTSIELGIGVDITDVTH
jgi:hypothetical protein